MGRHQDRQTQGSGQAHRAPIGILSPRFACLLAGILLSSSACATFPGTGAPSLHEQVDAILYDPPLNQVNWGIRIVDPERGRILYSRNGHRKFVPASNMKLLGTATALSLLGPEYRYHTDLWGVGRLDVPTGRLEGDLLLRPSGDPTLSDRFYPSAEAPLDSLAQGLWEAGVRSVSGTLIVDVSAWDSTTVPGSWMVQNLSGSSGATGGAFAVAQGEIAIEVEGGTAPGLPARARWWPETPNELLSVDFVTVPADSSTRGRSIDYFPESRHLRVTGGVRVGQVDTLRISQRDPVRLASALLLRALEKRGIQVPGGVHVAWDPGEPVGLGGCVTGGLPEAEPVGGVANPRPGSIPECPNAARLAGLTSPPMAEIVQAILEPSQNWMTEQLVRTLGMERGELGSWSEGFRVEKEFLVHEVGVDSLDLSFQDGSGLSAYNLVTPRALVRVLEFMRSSPHAGIFRNALASPGEEESTLENRLTDLRGRLFAKTGTITHVNSLSGYVFTDSGRELIFSVLTNGSGLPSALVRAGIDRIVEIAARY